MCVIGPCGAMPRIASFCYSLLSPFLPALTIPGTSYSAEKLLFLSLLGVSVYIATYKQEYILKLLGYILTPVKLLSLGVLLFKGLWFLKTHTLSETNTQHVFLHCMSIGNQTMDLLGGIFFGAAIVSLLKNRLANKPNYTLKQIVMTGIQAGLIGCAILAIVYYGLALLGAFYGQAAGTVVDKGELFSKISLIVLGVHGGFFVALAITISCFSTLLALALVLAEYIHNKISKTIISYRTALILVIITTMLFAYCGLEFILNFLGPLMNLAYPVLAVITLANIGYKFFNFTYIKIPVALTFAYSLYSNWTALKALFGA